MPDIHLQNYKHTNIPVLSNISTDLVSNPRYVAPKPVLCAVPLCQARTSGIRYILLCSSSGRSGYPTSFFPHTAAQGRDKPAKHCIFLGLIAIVVLQPADWSLLLTEVLL